MLRHPLKGRTSGSRQSGSRYTAVYPPPGDNISVTVELFAVEDGVPAEEEIEWAVKRLRNNRAGGPSRMRAGDLKGWFAAARRGEKERESVTKDRGKKRRMLEGPQGGSRELGAGGGPSSNGVSGGGSVGGVYMAGVSPHPQG